MEKKNTILLTVIAIATLLVAVVGATFAYFTAQVTTTNDKNNTVNVKTYALATVKMDYGNEVTNEGIYPGTTIVKDVTIDASCPAGSDTCEPVSTVLTITTTDEENVFGNDIKWTLYKMDETTREVTCTVTPQNSSGKYYAETECTGFDADANTLEHGTVVETLTGAGTKTIEIKAYGTEKTNATAKEAHNDKYYLVVEYLNNVDTTNEGATVSGEQNNQQGKEFSVKMNFASAA